jgi:SAM-dependent methyltransferase
VTRVEAPLPSVELVDRVGSVGGDLALYQEIGRRTREEILALLPEGWTFEGKRVLDFGCGAGRTLRHFVSEAEVAEIHGCEIDSPSVAWLEANLSPPFHVFRNDEAPPLPLESDSLDLIWAISVFTHLTDYWADWLLELHRLLRNGGLLIATILGPELAEASHPAVPDPGVSEPASPGDRIGMNVVHFGRGWDLGGPATFHSAWWIREHWGRAFDVLELREDGFIAAPGWRGQGVVVLAKQPGVPSVEDLERIDAAEPREIAALRHNIRQLHHELAREQAARAWLEGEHALFAERLRRSTAAQ